LKARTLLADTTWADRRAATPWQIGVTTFGILALEFALIR